MAKMSKAQRTAILDFHNGVTSKGHTMIVARSSTIDVMVREGWAKRPNGMTKRLAAVYPPSARRTAYVTRAGLIAAGVDMDAIHAEAANVDRMITHNRREHAHAEALNDVPPVVLVMDDLIGRAAEARAAEDSARARAAARAEALRETMDAIHADARDEDAERDYARSMHRTYVAQAIGYGRDLPGELTAFPGIGEQPLPSGALITIADMRAVALELLDNLHAEAQGENRARTAVTNGTARRAYEVERALGLDTSERDCPPCDCPRLRDRRLSHSRNCAIVLWEARQLVEHKYAELDSARDRAAGEALWYGLDG